MAWFLCNVGNGGSELTVTCDSVFAGATITCTDGVTTLIKTCPSSSPYIVKFNIPNSGIWTVSSGASSTSVVITDSIDLHDIPVGATVIPTDDVETWLHCANIWNKSYTTINQVLADTSTLLALISSNNAADYMARSTNWASTVCANSMAMTFIGNNNYCANKLLENSTWRTAICNSTYFESVLNVKVPTMTSNTTPSGVASGTNYSGEPTNYPPFYAFDGNDNTKWVTNNVNPYIQYQFPSAKKIYMMKWKANQETPVLPPTAMVVKGSNNGSTYSGALATVSNVTADTSEHTAIFSTIGSYSHYKVECTHRTYQGQAYSQLATLQFYGR